MKRPQTRVQCGNCSQHTPGHDIIYFTTADKTTQLCSRCFNEAMAKEDGLTGFQHPAFEPIEISDCRRIKHTFYFRTHFLGDIVAIDAFELRKGIPSGYQFQQIGDPEDDPMEIFAQLVQKIRRTLSTVHLKKTAHGIAIASPNVVRGKITWDPDTDGQEPLLLIDGQAVTWQQFGRMLMTFEGIQFKLELRDKSDEL